MYRRVVEGVMTAIIIGIMSGFVALFMHVQELDANIILVKSKFDYIKDDLNYIKKRVDHLYEKGK